MEFDGIIMDAGGSTFGRHMKMEKGTTGRSHR
jgi:hypothetical protein